MLLACGQEVVRLIFTPSPVVDSPTAMELELHPF